MSMRGFVEWDQIEIRVNGEKLNALVQSFRVEPIERLEVRFENALMRVAGSVRKFVSIPFEVQISEILASGRTVRVPLRSVSAFGAIPIPKFLFGLMRDRLPADLVRYEEPATLVFSLDRFMPNFVDADIHHIWLIDVGLAGPMGSRRAPSTARTEGHGCTR